VLEQALDGGVQAIQVREKDLDGKKLFLLAEKVRDLCARYQAALFVNDRIDVAQAVAADGVQLGTAALPIDTARQLLGPCKMIGASTHSLKEAQTAEGLGADFVVFGPVYSTPSKAAFGPPQGLAALKKIVENTRLPVYAIGGINPENLREVMRVGTRGISLISAVLGAVDPKAASSSMKRMLERI
jgi:thiamine-phosphate pyrophosphorylase